MLVDRVTALGDDAFPALGARALPRLVLVERGDASQRCTKRQRLQQRAPFVERERRDVAAVDPEDVEHVIRETARLVGLARRRRSPHASDFAVENQLLMWQTSDGIGDGRVVLFQPVA